MRPKRRHKVFGTINKRTMFHSKDNRKQPGRNVMKRSLTALVLAGTLATATMAAPTQAYARWGWGGGWGWGLGGLAAGLLIGAALARPAYGYGYPAYGYGYPAYGYGYGYPAYSYGYAYPAYGYGYYGGYRPRVYARRAARRVAIHRARWH
jgi:hypothetical protein